ncbi:hypothetical protein OEZ86_006267 [Tetradesmus obliquus]|nr:hypothetical protein OEZ86_006267 [Tetradesmus obliquus]
MGPRVSLPRSLLLSGHQQPDSTSSRGSTPSPQPPLTAAAGGAAAAAAAAPQAAPVEGSSGAAAAAATVAAAGEAVFPKRRPLVRVDDPVKLQAIRLLAVLGQNEQVRIALGDPPIRGRGLRVLAMDGGGMKGLALVELLRQLQRRAGAPIWSLFDVIGGTSTGGLLAVATGILQLELDECQDIYTKLGNKVFHSSVSQEEAGWKESLYRMYATGSASMRVAVYGAKHDAAPYEELLRQACAVQQLGCASDRLIDTAVLGGPKVFVVATLASERPAAPFAFRNYELPEEAAPAAAALAACGGSCKHHVWEAVRASSAAPYYLDDFLTPDGKRFQDGATTANNPAVVALAQARLLHPQLPIDVLVSLGCGAEPPAERSKGLSSVIDTGSVLLESACSVDRVHEALAATLPLVPGCQYYRFNPIDARCAMELDDIKPDPKTQGSWLGYLFPWQAASGSEQQDGAAGGAGDRRSSETGEGVAIEGGTGAGAARAVGAIHASLTQWGLVGGWRQQITAVVEPGAAAAELLSFLGLDPSSSSLGQLVASQGPLLPTPDGGMLAVLGQQQVLAPAPMIQQQQQQQPALWSNGNTGAGWNMPPPPQQQVFGGDVEQQQTSPRKGKKNAPDTSADATPAKKRSSKAAARPKADDDTAKDQADAAAAATQEEQHQQQQHQDEEEDAADNPPAEQAKSAGKAAGSSHAYELPEGTIEQGRIFFLYKPTVETEQVSGLRDVQRFFVLLQPQQPSGGSCRLIIIGKKKLPSPTKHERYFAFVEATAGTPKELTEGLTASTYETKTRGQRKQGPARAAGEGSYVLAKGGSKGGVHLGYVLELPAEPGQAQKVLGIAQQGSFVLSAKNPDNKGRRGVPSAGPEPAYTEQQRQQFQGRAWIGVEDASLLDVAGTELLLVGAKADPITTHELGAASDALQQASDEEGERLRRMGQQQQEQQLQQALEPAEGGGAAEGGEAPIPVGPAVTGELK